MKKNTLIIALYCSMLLICNAQALEPETVASLKTALRKIQDADQATRLEIEEKSKTFRRDSPEIRALWNKQNAIDIENQKFVTDFLATHGWPEASTFGSVGPAQVIFLVIQHANLDYQKRYYEMARTAAEEGNLHKGSFALLEDRIKIKEGKAQRYGSQVKFDPNTGKPSFYPIEDEMNVDKRRAEVGLQPLSEYAKLFNFEYTPQID